MSGRFDMSVGQNMGSVGVCMMVVLHELICLVAPCRTFVMIRLKHVIVFDLSFCDLDS